jgi:hypothetical protein
MWPDELGIELANVHGGAVDRPAVGRPTPTEMGRAVWSASFTVQMWCSCAREVSEKEDGGVKSTEQLTLVSSVGTPTSDSHGGEAYHGRLR